MYFTFNPYAICCTRGYSSDVKISEDPLGDISNSPMGMKRDVSSQVLEGDH